jgi:hypothetical protein
MCEAPNLEFSNPSIYAGERIGRDGGAGVGVVGPQCVTNTAIKAGVQQNCVGERLKES